MAAIWTPAANMFSSMEQNGWQLFNGQGREITRSTDLNQPQTLNQNYTVKLRSANLQASGTPSLAYTGANSTPASGSVNFPRFGAADPAQFRALVEDVASRHYGNITFFTAKAPGVTIPPLDTVPLTQVYEGEEVTLTVSGGDPLCQIWAHVQVQTTRADILPYTANAVGDKVFKFTCPPEATGLVCSVSIGSAAAGNKSFTFTPIKRPVVTLPDTLALKSIPAIMTRGTDTTFTWEGGKKPYDVQILSADQHTVLDRVTIGGNDPLSYTADGEDDKGDPIPEWEAGKLYFFVSCAHDDPAQSGNQFKMQAFTLVEKAVVVEPLAADANNPTTGLPNTAVILKWTDGKTPYSYNLLGAGGEVIDYSDSTLVTQYSVNQPAGNYTLKVKDANGDTIFMDISIQAPKTKAYLLTSSDVAAITAANAVMLVNGSKVTGAMQLNYGDKLEIDIAQGYEFVSDQYGIKAGFATSVTDYERFTANPKKTVGTYTIAPLNPPSGVFESFYIETQVHTRVSGTNHVYLVDNDIMRALTTVRFETVTDSDGNETTWDWGQFIINLIQLPFKVPANLVSTVNTETIRLGNKNTAVPAYSFLTDLIPLDLGTIKVPATNGDMTDFANTVATLHLPYVPAIAVDLQYVIGQELSVVMEVDAYNGKATILLTSSAAPGDVFYQKTVDLGIKIPYANLNKVDAENTSIDLGAPNGVTVPFIELSRNDAVLPYSMFNAVVPRETYLDGVGGYVEVENIMLESEALADEKREIIRLLKDGVVFK